MFEHSLSGKCKYRDKCTKKLCAFQHENKDVSENELEENVDNIEKPFEMLSDSEIKAVDEIIDEDEESFQTYVQAYHPVLFRKFKTDKTIKCYYCDFLPRSKRLKDLEDEMRTYIIENHNHVIEGLDPEIFDDEFHQEFIELFIDE